MRKCQDLLFKSNYFWEGYSILMRKFFDKIILYVLHYYNYNSKHSITKFKPIYLKGIQDESIIIQVIQNIKLNMSKKAKIKLKIIIKIVNFR